MSRRAQHSATKRAWTLLNRNPPPLWTRPHQRKRIFPLLMRRHRKQPCRDSQYSAPATGIPNVLLSSQSVGNATPSPRPSTFRVIGTSPASTLQSIDGAKLWQHADCRGNYEARAVRRRSPGIFGVFDPCAHGRWFVLAQRFRLSPLAGTRSPYVGSTLQTKHPLTSSGPEGSCSS